MAYGRGLLKFRDGMKSNKACADGLTYKTRWDGKLSEAQLFSKVESLGAEARTLFRECGGRGEPSSTETDEMTFAR